MQFLMLWQLGGKGCFSSWVPMIRASAIHPGCLLSSLCLRGYVRRIISSELDASLQRMLQSALGHDAKLPASRFSRTPWPPLSYGIFQTKNLLHNNLWVTHSEILVDSLSSSDEAETFPKSIVQSLDTFESIPCLIITSLSSSEWKDLFYLKQPSTQ